MADTMTVVAEPSKLHSVHGSLHEPMARDVAYILVTAFALASDDAGREDVCLRILRFCNALAMRSIVFAGSVVTIICREDRAILPSLARTARLHKSNPEVGPFLSMLKARVLLGSDEERVSLLRECEVKAGVWQGLSMEEILPYLKMYDIEPGNG